MLHPTDAEFATCMNFVHVCYSVTTGRIYSIPDVKYDSYCTRGPRIDRGAANLHQPCAPLSWGYVM
eukprot:14836453-Ditylum_brightwellii.AAC.1